MRLVKGSRRSKAPEKQWISYRARRPFCFEWNFSNFKFEWKSERFTSRNHRTSDEWKVLKFFSRDFHPSMINDARVRLWRLIGEFPPQFDQFRLFFGFPSRFAICGIREIVVQWIINERQTEKKSEVWQGANKKAQRNWFQSESEVSRIRLSKVLRIPKKLLMKPSPRNFFPAKLSASFTDGGAEAAKGGQLKAN